MEDLDWNQLLPGYVWKARYSKCWTELMPEPSAQLSYLLPKHFEGSCVLHAYSETLTMILRKLVSKDMCVDLAKLLKICVDNGVLRATGTSGERLTEFVNSDSAIPLEGSLPAEYDLSGNPVSFKGSKLVQIQAKRMPFSTPTPEQAKEAMDFRERLCSILDSHAVVICFPLQKHYQEHRDGGVPYRLREGEENYVKRSRKTWWNIGRYFGLFGSNERVCHCATAFAYDCSGGDVRTLRIHYQENAIRPSGSQPGAIHPDQTDQPGWHAIHPDAIQCIFVPLVTEAYFCKTPNNHTHTNLHSIGGLSPPLGYLKNSNDGILAKALKVVDTIVENNPKSEKLVMESNGLEQLLTNFKTDPSTNAHTKALGAISCNSQIRHSQPGISAFRLETGYAGLKDAHGFDDARLQRKALNLIQYLLQNNKADRSIARELGLPKLMMHLASSDDSLVREAALSGLLELAQDKTSGNALPDQDKLKDILKSRIEGISAMDSDDLHAIREERQLVDSLWKQCYNEPSSLREKGLVVLPGEDAPQQPPPDVAGKMFEPPLRAWAAARPAQEEDSDSGSGKKDPPLMLKF